MDECRIGERHQLTPTGGGGQSLVRTGERFNVGGVWRKVEGESGGRIEGREPRRRKERLGLNQTVQMFYGGTWAQSVTPAQTRLQI